MADNPIIDTPAAPLEGAPPVAPELLDNLPIDYEESPEGSDEAIGGGGEEESAGAQDPDAAQLREFAEKYPELADRLIAQADAEEKTRADVAAEEAAQKQREEIGTVDVDPALDMEFKFQALESTIEGAAGQLAQVCKNFEDQRGRIADQFDAIVKELVDQGISEESARNSRAAQTVRETHQQLKQNHIQAWQQLQTVQAGAVQLKKFRAEADKVPQLKTHAAEYAFLRANNVIRDTTPLAHRIIAARALRARMGGAQAAPPAPLRDLTAERIAKLRLLKSPVTGKANGARSAAGVAPRGGKRSAGEEGALALIDVG